MHSEAYFYNLWDSLPLNKNILTGQGELKILNKGELSTNIGPDFQGVRISLNNQILSGDIEIHIRSSDWYFHGHHLNPEYNNVVLHLVWNQENKEIVSNNGLKIPEISFKDLVRYHFEDLDKNHDKIDYFFQRYARKVAYCDELLQFHTPEDVFWILLARSLGYKRNADTMEMFARVFYPSRVKQLHPDISTLKEFFRYAAFYKDKTPGVLKSNDLPRLKVPWRNGGRPANSPQRRIEYLSLLLEKFWDINLYNFAAKIIESRKDQKFILKEFYDFLRIDENDLNPGKMRIMRFIINWFIPLAYAVNTKNPAFQLYLLDLYWMFPPEDVSERMIKIFGKPANAAETQGYYEWEECKRGNMQYWLSEIRIPYGI